MKNSVASRLDNPGGIFCRVAVNTLILLLFLTTGIDAATGNASNAIVKLSNMLKTMHSATADFKQTITDAQGMVLQTATGNMRISKPGYFWWQIQTPTRQLIVVKSNTVYFYQADLSQLAIRPFDMANTQTPATLLLNGNAQILQQQYLGHETHKHGLTIFTLLPKTPDRLLQSIQIAFEGNKLAQLNLADHFNRVTKVTFSNLNLNRTLSRSQFNFTYPKGTDVIHESA